jgi:hypothetical protein
MKVSSIKKNSLTKRTFKGLEVCRQAGIPIDEFHSFRAYVVEHLILLLHELSWVIKLTYFDFVLTTYVGS